jgi:hypothetical protein
MLDKIIATFCLLDDLLKILHHRHDPQAKIPDREMLAIAILACQAFGGSRRQALQPVGQSPSALLVVESVGSYLHSVLPCRVHAVNLDGFVLQRMCYVYAHNFNLLHKVAS